MIGKAADLLQAWFAQTGRVAKQDNIASLKLMSTNAVVTSDEAGWKASSQLRTNFAPPGCPRRG